LAVLPPNLDIISFVLWQWLYR